MVVVRFEKVTKRYGNRVAVADLNFSAMQGEVLGLLGPNGAGKSTTLRLLTSYLLPTSGHVTVFGYDTATHALEARRRIGYLPEEPPLYPELTTREYLDFVARAKGVPASRRRAEVDEVIERVGLASVAGRLLGNLSRGYRQRAGIGQALLGNPDLLVLDEPTIGLDPVQIIEIRDLIKGLAQNRTVIFSSHILPEVQAICSRVIIINKGRVIAEGAPDILSQNLQGGWRYLIEVDGPADEVEGVLSRVPGVERVEPSAGGEHHDGHPAWVVSSRDADIRRDIFFALAGAGFPIMRLEPQSLSLEQVFLHLVTEEGESPKDQGLIPEDKGVYPEEGVSRE